jgi:hypothetical protein
LPGDTGGGKPGFGLVVSGDASPYSDTNPNSNADPHANANANANTNSNTDADPNPHADTNPDTHANTVTNPNRNANTNPHVDRITNADAHVELHFGAHVIVDVVPRHTLVPSGADVQTDADAHPASDANTIHHRPGPE